MAAIAGGQRRGMAMGRRKPNARWDVLSAMLVFLDFEASSLGKRSYPIEVGWVFEDGRSEAHLIRPAPGTLRPRRSTIFRATCCCARARRMMWSRSA